MSSGRDEPVPFGEAGAAKASAALDGYFFQVDVSIWAALDLLLIKRVAGEVILEPPSQEDLEAHLSEDGLSSDCRLASYRLVIQAKLRGTGPWDVEELARLLQHGKRRMSAALRLADPAIRYLLVTSADVGGVARDLLTKSLVAFPGPDALPKSLQSIAPTAAGRMAILAGLDQEKLGMRLRELIQTKCRVPHLRYAECLAELREAALERMRGIEAGRWTAQALESVIKRHEGFLAASAEAEAFVPPTNWSRFEAALCERHAVVITGASGTGKTTVAEALWLMIRDRVPGLARIDVTKGPQQVRANMSATPVLFMVEDPWGRYRSEPGATHWTTRSSTS